MKTLEFVPKVGIGPVKLGMTRGEARSSMKQELGADVNLEESWRDLFLSNGLIVYYSDEVCTSLGVFNLYLNGYQVFHQGINLFDITSSQFLSHFGQYDTFDSSILEKTVIYLFPKIGISAQGAEKQYDYIGERKRKVFHSLSVLDDSSVTKFYQMLEELENERIP